MKLIPAAIAAMFGLGFLTVGMRYNYDPPILPVSSLIESSSKQKARAAVSALLLKPDDAVIDNLREVRPRDALYVCGLVNSKSRSGQYAGPREFVYHVAHDYAAIDDDEPVARSHRKFRPCPDDEKQKPLVVDLDKVANVVAMVPKPNIAIAMPSMESRAANAGPGTGPGNGQDLRGGIEGLKQSVPQLITQPSGTASPPSQSQSAELSPIDENEWRSERPPKRWPQFPPGDPRSKLDDAVISDNDPLKFAGDIERGWKRFINGQSVNRPAVAEIEQALRALMTVRTESPLYPQAWAIFVRLSNVRRDLIAAT